LTEKYLVIDMDGTLYRKRHEERAAREISRRLYKYTARFNIPKEEVAEIVNKYIKSLRVSLMVYLISRRYGLDTVDFVEYAYDIHPSSFGIREDAKLAKLLLRLSKKRRILIFTNSPMIWTNRVIGALGLDGIIRKRNIIGFEALDWGKSSKPSERSFRILLKKTGDEPSDVLLLEDSCRNIGAARKLGIRTIRICNKPAYDKRRGEDIHTVLGRLADEA
jgi:putative hydrolase of the HAD superfamily